MLFAAISQYRCCRYGRLRREGLSYSLVFACKRPILYKVVLAVGSLRNVEGYLRQFVSSSVHKEHILASAFFTVAESVTEVETEFVSVNNCREAGPIPSILVRPHTSTPIESSQTVRTVEDEGLIAVFDVAGGCLTVDFGVVVERVFVAVKRTGDYHIVFGKIGQRKVDFKALSRVEVGVNAGKVAFVVFFDEIHLYGIEL